MSVREAASRVICVYGLAGLLAAVGMLALAGPAEATAAGATAWGDNEHGQLGDGATGEGDDSPVAVSALNGVTAVTVGDEHSMALLGGGTVVAWGSNAHGQLGDGTTTDSDVPVNVMGLSEVSAISAGGANGLALLSNGNVMAWGDNYHGQLGDGNETDSGVPVKVSALSGVKSVAAGGAHSLALLSDGKVMAWGWNGQGQLGNGSFTDSDLPVAVSGLSEVAAVAAGEAHSLALLKDGTVMAWGSNAYGQLGNGDKTESDVPVEVTGLSEVTAIAGGGSHSLALLRDGKVMAWGDNEYGQLGDGGEEQSSDVPVEVKGLSEVTAIAAGGSHSLALLKNGTVMAWGNDLYGQLGDSSYKRSSDVPVEVAGLSEVTAIAGGQLYSLAASSPPKPFPTLSSAAPGYGAPAGGAHVTIRGTGFDEVTAVKFGSANAESFKVESETEITAVAPAGTGTVDVRVTTAKGGNSPISRSDEFNYRPAVTNLEPGYGAPAGGSHVTITGTNFNEVGAVKFGSSNAVSFKVESETTITAVAPAGTGTVEVTVTTPGGTSPTGLADKFSYEPNISKLEPNYGPPAGGTHVTITGTNFNEVSAVKFGSVAAISFKVESETTIEAVAPAGTGVVEVTVTTLGGTSPTGFSADDTVPDEFSYAPVITGVTPGHGAPAGGTEVTITGTNFTSATAVRFGANGATSFKVESDTKITAVTPAFGGGAEDGVGVYVTTPGGTNTSEECGYPRGYRYEPTITKVEPDSGPVGGGTHVTIRGVAFEGTHAGGGFLCNQLEPVVQSVKFGSKAATHWSVVSDTEITAVAPAGSGTVDVTIESVVGTSPVILDDEFSYITPPPTQEPKTEAATSVTSTSAILEGTLEPAATKLKYDFQYNAGTGCEGGSTTQEAEGEDRVPATVEGLKPNTEYAFCLIAKSAEGGTAVGRAETFRTAESQAEIQAREKLGQEAEAKAKAEAEAKTKAEAEATAAKKKQEEEAAAKKKKEEAATTGGVSLVGSTISVQSSGKAQVKLACAGIDTCTGKLALTVKTKNKGKHKQSKTTTIGTATFSIPAGKTATIKVELNGTGRALLGAARGHLGTTLTILKVSPVPSKTQTKSVRLVQQKPAKAKQP
jgi:alpha-tubulin suppressor-like RCC1 family protein